MNGGKSSIRGSKQAQEYIQKYGLNRRKFALEANKFQSFQRIK